ncbi:MAG TPA: PfkB family carbohydrate kinase, partial [Gaiellales bacterium]
MLQLAVIGHVEWVTFAHAPFVPGPGEIVHLTDPMPQPGGGGAVTAVALARMGAEVTFFTTLGSDGRARPELERHGVRIEAALSGR